MVNLSQKHLICSSVCNLIGHLPLKGLYPKLKIIMVLKVYLNRVLSHLLNLLYFARSFDHVFSSICFIQYDCSYLNWVGKSYYRTTLKIPGSLANLELFQYHGVLGVLILTVYGQHAQVLLWVYSLQRLQYALIVEATFDLRNDCF